MIMNMFSAKEQKIKTGYITTFDLDEEVYTLYNNEVIIFKINSIEINHEKEIYFSKYKNDFVNRTQDKLFRTKQELVNFIIK